MKKIKQNPLLALLLASLLFPLWSNGVNAEVRKDVSYVESTDAYRQQRCKLDLYLPDGKRDFPMIVWFHGGSITAGDKKSCERLAQMFVAHDIGFAAVNYRLSPKVKYPAYLEDAAASVAWVAKQSVQLGYTPGKLFVGGHSAGAYLATMLAMDEHYLKDAGIDVSEIAGILSVSGQMTTHFTVLQERGLDLPKERVTSDEAAPIYYTRKDTIPLLLMIGDNDWPARLEENQFFAAALKKVAGNQKVRFEIIASRTHGSINDKMTEPNDAGAKVIFDFMAKTGQ
jgi:acetyl esterase/lipase